MRDNTNGRSASLLAAATQLDEALRTLATHLWQHCLSPEADLACGEGLLQTAFALLPEVTDTEDDAEISSLLLEVHLPVLDDEAASATLREAAIGVKAKALGAALAHHTATAAVSACATPVSIDRSISGVSSAVAPQGCLFTTAFLQQLPECFPPPVVALMLTIMPAHDGLWNYRRHYLRSLRPPSGLQPAERQEEHAKVGHVTNAFALVCVQDMMLVNFLLGSFHKLQSLYVYRAWLVRELTEVLAAVGVCHVERFAYRLIAFDWRSCFAFAAEQHPRNYNGWNYRRAIMRTFLQHMHQREQIYQSNTPAAYVQCEFEKTVAFMRVNNGDSSAVAYLLHLLETAATLAHDRQQPDSQVSRQIRCVNHRDAIAADPHRMWRLAFALSQQQIRLHAERGHESLFLLRHGLVDFALRHATVAAVGSANGSRSEGRGSFTSGWTVADELAWVSVLVDGWAAEEQLLAPTPPLANAWVQCSGTNGLTSFLASRYALQLIDLLRRHIHT